MRLRVYVIIIVLILTSKAYSRSLEPRIDSLLSHYGDDHLFMGSVLIADKDEVIFSKGYGLANIDQDVANTPETKFLIGSITKQFTAVLVMRLVEQGRLSLDDTISRFIPYLPADVGDRITVEMLLSHTSGLTLPEGIEAYYNLTEVDSYIKQAVSAGLRFEPGKGYGYSNTGYAILGRIIEEVTGKPYGQVLREEILSPLGMTNTGCNKRNLTLENGAESYASYPDNPVMWSEEQSFDPAVIFFGSGFMYSTVNDLFKFSRALFSNELLSSALMDAHLKMRVDKSGPPVPGITQDQALDLFGKCGSGFVGEICVLDDPDGETTQTLYWHDGTMKFFKSYNFYCAENDRRVIILSNRGFLGEGDEIALKILRILNDQPFAHIKIKHVLRQYLEDEIAMHAGIPITIEEYLRLKDDTLNFIVPNEKYLHWAGGVLIELGDIEGAVLALQTLVSLMPEYWEGYDALVEACLLKGDSAMALQYCRKSLELNPQNKKTGELFKRLAGE